ncbi:MAG: ankyrin repeat domain-containing protein [Planctomycetes bacterium]|nr:ankyrin repeat domain-containing protein [Planctomycetota bacterium]
MASDLVHSRKLRIALIPVILLLLGLLAYLVWSEPFNPLHRAISVGDLAKVDALLADHPELVRKKDRDGWTALHYATNGNHPLIVTRLLAHDSQIDAQTSQRGSTWEMGWTALHMAANNSNVTIVEALLGGAANPNLKSESGQTPLHMAAMGGQVSIARMLLANGADPDAANRLDITPLAVSTIRNHAEFATLLVTHVKDIDHVDNNGATALHYAVHGGHEALTRLLLAHGASSSIPDNSGQTAVDVASTYNNAKIIALMKNR